MRGDVQKDDANGVVAGMPRQANLSLRPDFAATLERGNLPSLDGLRAVAVFLVIFYHFGIPRVDGGLGVLIFFVISGFLITWLLLKEEERWGNVSLRLFYIRRTLRIFPAFYAYWLLVVVGFGVVLGKKLIWPQALASFLYVNNYYQALFGDPGTGLSHTWSLAVEEQFYVLWPLSFILLRTNNRRIAVLQGAILIVWIYRIVLVLCDVRNGYIYEALDTRADHLLIGCLLATMMRSGRGTVLWNMLIARPASIWLTFALLALVSRMPAFAGIGFRNSVGYILAPLLTAVLIVQAIAFNTTSAAWMNWRWISYLGRISYSLYLYQQIAMDPVKKLLGDYPVSVQLFAAVAAVLLTASASYYVVEQPFLKLKDQWGKRRKPDTSPTVEARRFQSAPMP